MSKWRVELRGLDEGMAGKLADLLDRPELCVEEERGHVYLTGTRLDVCATPEEAKRLVALEILPPLRGVLALTGFPSGRPISTGAVCERLHDGSERVEVHLPIEITVHAFESITVTDEGEPDDEKGQFTKLMKLAESDATAKRILGLLGPAGQPGWVDLYKINELVEADCKGKPSLWSSNAERDLFRASANRYDVSGDAARHAVNSGGTPAKAMGLEEAQRVILQLVKRWVSQRLTQPS